MIEEEIVGSHTEDSEQDEQETTPMDDVYKAFGIESEEKEDEEATPAIEKTPKTIKVKYNKEEVEVPEDQIPDLVEKGMNLDKVRNQKNEYEKALDEVAQLQGFKDHADLLANLPKLREQQQQNEIDEFNKLRDDLRQEFIANGLDPDKAEAYVENHPLIKKAKEELQKSEERMQQEMEAQILQEHNEKWQALYQKYPDLIESSRAFDRGEIPEWFTPEMQSRYEKGYDPIDAYELAHRDKLTAQTKKAHEQKIIKEQHLGLRSKVETVTTPDDEPTVPEALANAFKAFDLPVSAAKKYVKK